MGLNITILVTKPVEVYSDNITHNLGKMAAEVKLSNGMTLYQVLWRPDEHQLVLAKDIGDLLDEAWNILLSNPNHYRQFNPHNGWGSYDGLCQFVHEYRNACLENLSGEISVCR